jgi:hypothetical protein
MERLDGERHLSGLKPKDGEKRKIRERGGDGDV